jgi:hypothetical protein
MSRRRECAKEQLAEEVVPMWASNPFRQVNDLDPFYPQLGKQW